MKPLNRPMFRYGGPIKEGIMTGMKDNRQAINTVGSPLAPKDETGRGGYAAPLLFTLPYLGAAARFAARPFGQFIARQSKGGKMLGLKPIEKFQPNIFGKYLAGSPEGRLLTGGAGVAGKTGKTIFKAGKSLAKSPLTLAAGVYYGGGALLPDGTPDPNDPKNIKSGEGRQFTGDEAMVGDPRKPLPDSPPKLSKSEENEALKQKYYRIMGLDKMKKDAVYDSLIDASRIVSEEGGDLKGSLKSGTLQNKIIQAISGQLDKSAALKKQIDAAILKGEITKDIKQSDPAEKNKAKLVEKQIELADQKLSGGTLIDNISEGIKNSGGANSTSNVYNAVLKTYKTEPEVLADTTEAAEFRKSDNYTTDAALVKTIVETRGKGAGIYILDKTAIYVDEQGNASTLFQG